MPDWGSDLSLLGEIFRVVNSLQIVGCCSEGGVYDEILSRPLLFIVMQFFFFFSLICSLCRSYLSSFWVSLRGNCSIFSCRSTVSVGGNEFRIHLHHHLDLKLGGVSCTHQLSFNNLSSHSEASFIFTPTFSLSHYFRANITYIYILYYQEKF